MNANQMNAKALANTARQVAQYATSACWTIKALVLHWNLCVQQAGYNGTFDIPGDYKRKAAIIADMEKIAVQLDRIAEGCDPLTGRIAIETIEAQRAAGLPVDEEGNDTREWCGDDVEAAHAEALAEDYRFNWLDNRFGIFWAGSDFFARRSMIEDAHDEALRIAEAAAHAEALEINAAIDAMVDEREHVSNCSYEGFQEQDRINQIGKGCVLNLPDRLGDTFADVRRLALRLWERGFVTYPPEECGVEYVAACVECRAQWVWGA